jgi:hypothetical protein
MAVSLYEVRWPDDAPTETVSVLGLGIWKRGEIRVVPLAPAGVESLRAKGFEVLPARKPAKKGGE